MRIEDKIKELIVTALTKSQGMNNDEINEVGLELSRNKNNEHGDFSSNIALKLSGKLKRSPMVVAEEIINSIFPDQFCCFSICRSETILR